MKFIGPKRWTGKVLGSVVGAALVLTAPAAAMASSDDVNSKIYDGRLEGYPNGVTIDGSSTALMWLLLGALGGLTVGVLFKNARRTHLD